MKWKITGIGIAVIAFLLIVALYFFCPHHLCLRTTCAKRAEARADIQNIGLAVRLYEVDTGELPSSLDQLVSNTENVNGWRGSYLIDGIPPNPLGEPYSRAKEQTREE